MPDTFWVMIIAFVVTSVCGVAAHIRNQHWAEKSFDQASTFKEAYSALSLGRLDQEKHVPKLLDLATTEDNLLSILGLELSACHKEQVLYKLQEVTKDPKKLVIVISQASFTGSMSQVRATSKLHSLFEPEGVSRR